MSRRDMIWERRAAASAIGFWDFGHQLIILVDLTHKACNQGLIGSSFTTRPTTSPQCRQEVPSVDEQHFWRAPHVFWSQVVLDSL